MGDFVIAVLFQKLTGYAKYEFVSTRLRKEILALKDDLDEVKPFLIEVNGIVSGGSSYSGYPQHIKKGFETWMKDLRESIYNVEDHVDKIMFNVLMGFRAKISSSLQFVNGYGSGNIESIPSFKVHLVAIKRLRRAIRRSKRDAIDKHMLKGKPSSSSTAKHVLISRTTSCLAELVMVEPKQVELVGVDDFQERLKWLLFSRELEEQDVDEDQFRAIFVTGTAGIGKTALVKKIWDSNQVKKYFDCQAWVAYTPSLSSKQILRNMLDEFYNEAAPYTMDQMVTEPSLVQAIHDYLIGKKFLLVMDDVRDARVWNSISLTLPINTGGRVVFTTRDVRLAEGMGIPYFILPVEKLRQGDVFALLNNFGISNFGGIRGTPSDIFPVIAGEIVKECDGIPRSIITAAEICQSLLLFDCSQYDDWTTGASQAMKEIILQNIRRATNKDNADLISFRALSSQLKYVFLYCSLFFMHEEISVKKLIRLCVAQGFIQDNGDATAEEISMTCVKQLVQKNFFEGTYIGYSGSLDYCRLNDRFSHLAFSVTQEEMLREFCTQFATLPEHACRVSIISNTSDILSHKNDRYHFIRSCFVIDVEILPSSLMGRLFLGRYQLLNVLDFKNVKIIGPLSDVLGDLVHLRYLGLRGTGIKELPASLSRLTNLQTLDVRNTEVETLPPGLVKLVKLRHLLLVRSYMRKLLILPQGMKNLTHLQTLGGVRATAELVVELGRWTQLRKLCIGKIRGEDSIKISNSINQMNQLQSLTIKSDLRKRLQMTLLSPKDSLQTLRIEGPFEPLSHVINCYTFVTRLFLWDNNLDTDPFVSLQHLPRLALLCLSNAFNGKEVICSQGGFPALKKLSILRMERLASWKIQNPAMPNLERIFIGYCSKLIKIPQDLENVTNLLLVQVSQMPEEFIAELKQRGKNRYKVQIIPQFVHT